MCCSAGPSKRLPAVWLCRLRRAHQASAPRSGSDSRTASPARAASPAAAQTSDGVLRLVSGGQDCQVALWDFSAASEDSAMVRCGVRS